MKKESINIKSNCDGLDLYTTVFIPDKKIKGIVQVSHGMIEHQIYFYELMEFFTKKGYVCVVNDHRGHGKSIKNKKDLGYFYDESANYITDDLHQITIYIKERFPNLPIYLFGHSMGALIVLNYIKKYDKDIDKLIVCGLPSINHMAGPGLLTTKAFKVFKGKHYRSKFLHQLALTLEPRIKWLSINKEYIDACNKDVYCNYIFTTNGFINLTKLMKNAYSKKKWNLNNKKLPIYFIAGEDDIVIKNKDKWLKRIEFIRKKGYKNIEYKLYPGFKHAIFKDDVKLIGNDILKFIEK